ncbi:MAG: hypothetical protein ACLPSY_15460 [Steroidobacteraceae bacterium]
MATTLLVSVVRVEALAAGCVITNVVPGSTTVASLARNSDGMLKAASSSAVDTVFSSFPEARLSLEPRSGCWNHVTP